MAASLTLLTQRFPFATGEDFIATELHYLCQHFEEVHVIPTTALPRNAPMHRSLPNNAKIRDDVMAAIAATRMLADWQRALQVMEDADGRKLLKEECGQDKAPWHPPAALWSARMPLLLKAVGHALMMRDILRRYETPRLVYNFWLNASALGACLADSTRPVACRAHGADLYVERDPPYYIPLQRVTLRRLRRLFAICAQGQRYLQALHPNQADRILLHRLGVPAAETPCDASSDRVQRVLSVSSLLEVKQVHLIVTALHACRHQVEWTHMGDGPERERLQTMARSLPRNVRVVWAGRRPNAEVLWHYRTQPVDVFVNASRSEGLPVSIMEALSYGVPVIAPDIGGVQELVNDRNGVLLPAPVRAEALAQALSGLAVQDRAAASTMRTHALTTWAQLVDAQRVFPPFVTDLANLLIA